VKCCALHPAGSDGAAYAKPPAGSTGSGLLQNSYCVRGFNERVCSYQDFSVKVTAASSMDIRAADSSW